METITIDPRGDVCLVTSREGGSKVGYIVDSHLLGLASKVFEALFGPKFAEGRAMKESSVLPHHIELPDDDPIAMQTMLEVLHFRNPTLTIVTDKLIKLATVVDKYQVHERFKAHATNWMRHLLRKQGFASDLQDFLGLAIAFKSTTVFNMVSIGLALTPGNAKPLQKMSQRLGAARTATWIPDHMAGRIEYLRAKYLDEFTALLTFAPTSLAAKPSSTAPKRPLHDAEVYADHDEQTFANFHHHMLNLNIIKFASRQSPLQALLSVCRFVTDMKAEKHGRVKTIDAVSTCTSCLFIRHLEQRLFALVQTVLRSQAGLCLCCDVPASPIPSACMLHEITNGKDSSGMWPAPIQFLFGEALGQKLLPSQTEDKAYDGLPDFQSGLRKALKL